MSLSINIFNLIRGVLSNSDDDVRLLVNYLISDEMGVTQLCDLSVVTIDMLPQSVKIPLVKRKRLLEAFVSCASGEPLHLPSTSGTSGGSSSQNDSTSSAASGSRTDASTSSTSLQSLENVTQDASFFIFTVPWTQMPKETMDNLNKAKAKNVKAKPKDIGALKLAIAKKLKSAYVSHKEMYPGLTKTPGRKVYEKVTEQVETKFGDCVKTIIKGKVMKSGTSNFFRSFEMCIENLMRPTTGFPKSKVMKGKKVVGVDLDAYQPIMTSASKEVQQGIKEQMLNLRLLGTNQLDWPEIIINLKETYELQRADIILRTSEVFVGGAGPRNEQEEEMDLQERALEKLQSEWPFLFEMQGLELHHNTLTKRDLGVKLRAFTEQHLDQTLLFLTTSSKCNTENMIIRLQVEVKNDFGPEKKFLMMIQMLANNFSEDFSSLFLPAERTTQTDTFPHSILEEKKDPCIVALDNDIYAAKKLYACADQIALVEVNNPKDAFLALVQICFVFDLEYPPELPLTMEFIERYVLDMGVMDSKIMKKGRQILVLSEIVKKFITGLEEFTDELAQRLDN